MFVSSVVITLPSIITQMHSTAVKLDAPICASPILFLLTLVFLKRNPFPFLANKNTKEFCDK